MIELWTPLLRFSGVPTIDARAAVGRIGGQRLGRPLAGAQEGRLVDQVLRRIAGEEQLGEQHEVGALARGIGPRLARLGEIAGDVADDRVELGNGDAQDVGAGFLVMRGHVARPN